MTTVRNSMNAYDAGVLRHFIQAWAPGPLVTPAEVAQKFASDMPTIARLCRMNYLFQHDGGSMTEDDVTVTWGEGYTVTLDGLDAYCEFYRVDPCTIRLSRPDDQLIWERRHAKEPT